MAGNATLKESNSPQVIIEKLARKQISDAEAEEALRHYWGRAYDSPTLVRLLREVFGNFPHRVRMR